MAEQDAVLQGRTVEASLDFDSVGSMEFLQDCVKESLRMYPPLIMLMRMAMVDIETTLNGLLPSIFTHEY